MTDKEEKVIRYLTRKQRAKTIELMRMLESKELTKREYQKLVNAERDVLVSALEIICSRYDPVDEEEGEELMNEVFIKETENIVQAIKTLIKWDEDDDVRKA